MNVLSLGFFEFLPGTQVCFHLLVAGNTGAANVLHAPAGCRCVATVAELVSTTSCSRTSGMKSMTFVNYCADALQPHYCAATSLLCQYTATSLLCSNLVIVPVHCNLIIVPVHCNLIIVPVHCNLIIVPVHCNLIIVPVHCNLIIVPMHCNLIIVQQPHYCVSTLQPHYCTSMTTQQPHSNIILHWTNLISSQYRLRLLLPM